MRDEEVKLAKRSHRSHEATVQSQARHDDDSVGEERGTADLGLASALKLTATLKVPVTETGPTHINRQAPA
jgi:hypothetical protein